jgi:hypothetical protein
MGEAISEAIAINPRNSLAKSITMLDADAPITFRIPTSLTFWLAMKAINAYRPSPTISRETAANILNNENVRCSLL